MKTLQSTSAKHPLLTGIAFSVGLSLNFFLTTPSHASNVGGIFGPTVNEGDQTFQYRNAYDVDSEQFVQRIHYQHSLNDDFRLRGVIQARKTDDSDVDYDFFQGELLWELDDITSTWNHGLRFDFRITDDDRPDLFALSWTNKFHLSEDWTTTALILGSTDIGSDSRSGVFLQTRADIVRKLSTRWSLGVELFSTYGSTADFANSDEQTHQIGPALKGKLGNGWSLFAGILFGLTDASQDENFRLWITKSL